MPDCVGPDGPTYAAQQPREGGGGSPAARYASGGQSSPAAVECRSVGGGDGPEGSRHRDRCLFSSCLPRVGCEMFQWPREVVTVWDARGNVIFAMSLGRIWA